MSLRQSLGLRPQALSRLKPPVPWSQHLPPPTKRAGLCLRPWLCPHGTVTTVAPGAPRTAPGRPRRTAPRLLRSSDATGETHEEKGRPPQGRPPQGRRRALPAKFPAFLPATTSFSSGHLPLARYVCSWETLTLPVRTSSFSIHPRRMFPPNTEPAPTATFRRHVESREPRPAGLVASDEASAATPTRVPLEEVRLALLPRIFFSVLILDI